MKIIYLVWRWVCSIEMHSDWADSSWTEVNLTGDKGVCSQSRATPFRSPMSPYQGPQWVCGLNRSPAFRYRISTVNCPSVIASGCPFYFPLSCMQWIIKVLSMFDHFQRVCLFFVLDENSAIFWLIIEHMKIEHINICN